MQFIKIIGLLVFASCQFLVLPICLGQELRTNEKGEKIIVFPDGHWQYFTDFMAGEEEVSDPTAEVASKDGGNQKYPTFQGTIAPLEGNISVTEDDFRRIANRRAQIANDAAKLAKERAEFALTERHKLEKELTKAETSLNDPAIIKRLNVKLNAARRNETESNKEAQLAYQEAQRAENLVRKGDYIKAFVTNREQSRLPITIVSTPASSISYQNLIELEQGFFAIDKSNNVSINPPAAECNIAFDGVDNFNGQQRKDVQKKLLFTYTDERLRPFLKEKEYLTCEAFMTALQGGFRFLSLQFSFAYPNAREAYGFIEENSILTILLLNGEHINLKSGKMDRGSYDTENEVLTYLVHYPMTRSQINTLKRSEVSKIRVFWSSGYEDYEVYEMDFFLTQFHCLEK